MLEAKTQIAMSKRRHGGKSSSRIDEDEVSLTSLSSTKPVGKRPFQGERFWPETSSMGQWEDQCESNTRIPIGECPFRDGDDDEGESELEAEPLSCRKRPRKTTGIRKSKSALLTDKDLERSAQLLDCQLEQASMQQAISLLERNPKMVPRFIQWMAVHSKAQALRDRPEIPSCYSRMGGLSMALMKHLCRIMVGDKGSELSMIIDSLGRENPAEVKKMMLFLLNDVGSTKIYSKFVDLCELETVCRYLICGERMQPVQIMPSAESNWSFDWSGVGAESLGYYKLCFKEGFTDKDCKKKRGKVTKQPVVELEPKGRKLYSAVMHVSGCTTPLPTDEMDFQVGDRLHWWYKTIMTMAVLS